MLDAIPVVRDELVRSGTCTCILPGQDRSWIALSPGGSFLPCVDAILAGSDVSRVAWLLAHMIEMSIAVAIHIPAVVLPMHAPSERPLTPEMTAWEHRPSARLFDRGAVCPAAYEGLVGGGLRIADIVAPVVQHTVPIAIL